MIWLLTIVLTHAAPPPVLVQALSVRDPAPSCAELDALVVTPVPALRAVVDEVMLPPWAPMRAASCLVDAHPDEAADALVGWVQHDDSAGLARLLLGRLDRLPAPVSLRVATAALSGPYHALAMRRIRASQRPALRALIASLPE